MLARTALLEAILGPGGGWPVANRALRTAVFDPADPGHAAALRARGIPVGARLGRAEELSVTLLLGPRVHETRAYHLLPATGALNRLVIVHHGHSDTFADPSFRMEETLEKLLKAGYAVLAMNMPNYRPAPKSPPDVSPGGDRHGPIFGLPNSTSALRAFLEPVAARLGHLRQTHAYLDVHMTGLSGGGWTTALYAAVDPSVRASIHVSGSLPVDLRSGGSLGDEEQMHRPLYADTIGYRDAYTLGGHGSGRRQVQVLYEHDLCCFSDLQWPDPAGLAAELQRQRQRERRRQSGPATPTTGTVALLGKVACNVDASYGPIEVGDLLTTSETPGQAMKVTDAGRASGAVIGKALGALAEGRALVPILVALQ